MRERQRAGTGTGGGSLETQAPFSSAALKLPLTNTLAPVGGYGPATFTRATTATVFDNEGILKEVRAGAARFTGARCVSNIVPYSEDDPGWVAAGTTPPTVSKSVEYGGKNCTSATFASGLSGYSATRASSTSFTITTGRSYATRFLIAFDRLLVPTESILIVCTGAAGAVGSMSSTSAANIVTTSLTLLTPTTVTATGSGLNSIVIYPNASLLSPLTVYITEKQIEDVTGQSDQTASEYVSVGVLSTPWHGAGVDGVKYFTTNKDGTTIPDTYLQGYLTEGAQTNRLLYCRDLTNAAWVKSNTSAALTGNGIGGGTNTCSTLTATAGNGTCLQTITLAAASRSFSAYVKRRTGTGTISLTRDGGTSWTDVTSSLNTSGYTRVFIENTSVLNPSCGFRITTNGDAIDVDYCQDEAGAYASSPITTDGTAVTRNQDVLSYPVAGNMSLSSGTCYLRFGITERVSVITASLQVLCIDLNGRLAYLISGYESNKVSIYDGSAGKSNNTDGLSRAGNVLQKCSSRWGAGMAIISSGNMDIATTTFDGTLGTSAYLYVGSTDGSAGACHYGNFRDIYLWTTELTDTQMKQIVRG